MVYLKASILFSQLHSDSFTHLRIIWHTKMSSYVSFRDLVQSAVQLGALFGKLDGFDGILWWFNGISWDLPSTAFRILLSAPKVLLKTCKRMLRSWEPWELSRWTCHVLAYASHKLPNGICSVSWVSDEYPNSILIFFGNLKRKSSCCHHDTGTPLRFFEAC